MVDVSGMLEAKDWILISYGGGWLIGAPCKPDAMLGDHVTLRPGFAAAADINVSQDGQVALVRRALPLLASGSLKEVQVPSEGAVVLRCADMSLGEWRAWQGAIKQASALAEAIKAAECGLVLPNKPALVTATR